MTGNLCVALSFYNDLKSLQRSIPTYIEHVDKVYAIDGKYIGNPSLNDYSIDGSTEYLSQFPNVVLDKFVGNEYEKRNRYLKQECDYLLIIDSDEYVVEADWELFKKNVKIMTSQSPNNRFFGIKYLYNSKDWTPYPRLWFKPYLIEYHKAHNIFKNLENGQLSRSSSATAQKYLIEGITLTGSDEFRSKEYLDNTSKYQYYMKDFEKEARKLL